jgi:hypothetical protein
MKKNSKKLSVKRKSEAVNQSLPFGGDLELSLDKIVKAYRI